MPSMHLVQHEMMVCGKGGLRGATSLLFITYLHTEQKLVVPALVQLELEANRVIHLPCDWNKHFM